MKFSKVIDESYKWRNRIRVIISLWHFVCFTVAALSLKWLKWFFRSGAPLTEGRFLMYRGYQIRTYFWQIFLGFWPLWMGHSKLWWFQATIQSALLQWWQSAVNQFVPKSAACNQLLAMWWGSMDGPWIPCECKNV